MERFLATCHAQWQKQNRTVSGETRNHAQWHVISQHCREAPLGRLDRYPAGANI
jgi:hypothetical protein